MIYTNTLYKPAFNFFKKHKLVNEEFTGGVYGNARVFRVLRYSLFPAVRHYFFPCFALSHLLFAFSFLSQYSNGTVSLSLLRRMLGAEIELVPLPICIRHRQRNCQTVSNDNHENTWTPKKEAIRAATLRVWQRCRLLRTNAQKTSQKNMESD